MLYIIELIILLLKYESYEFFIYVDYLPYTKRIEEKDLINYIFNWFIYRKNSPNSIKILVVYFLYKFRQNTAVNGHAQNPLQHVHRDQRQSDEKIEDFALQIYIQLMISKMIATANTV